MFLTLVSTPIKPSKNTLRSFIVFGLTATIFSPGFGAVTGALFSAALGFFVIPRYL